MYKAEGPPFKRRVTWEGTFFVCACLCFNSIRQEIPLSRRRRRCWSVCITPFLPLVAPGTSCLSEQGWFLRIAESGPEGHHQILSTTDENQMSIKIHPFHFDFGKKNGPSWRNKDHIISLSAVKLTGSDLQHVPAARPQTERPETEQRGGDSWKERLKERKRWLKRERWKNKGNGCLGVSWITYLCKCKTQKVLRPPGLEINRARSAPGSRQTAWNLPDHSPRLHVTTAPTPNHLLDWGSHHPRLNIYTC